MPSPADVAFSPAAKAWQARHGSREAYARRDEKGAWRTEITPELAAFIAERDSFYLATASGSGQPYVQHRGGPKGFLKPLDRRTLAFADSAATGSSSRPETCRRIRRPSSSSWITRSRAA